MAGRNSVEAAVLEGRRAKVAEAVLRGKSRLKDIAAYIGLPDTQAAIMMVSKDLKKVREEWKANRLRCFDTDFGRELARLERLVRKAEKQFRKSCKPVRKVVRKYEQVLDQPALPELRNDAGEVIQEGRPATYRRVLVEQTVTREERPGDPRFLTLLKDLAADIRDLLGLTPKNVGDTSTSPTVVQFIVDGPPQVLTPLTVTGEPTLQPFSGQAPEGAVAYDLSQTEGDTTCPTSST